MSDSAKKLNAADAAPPETFSPLPSAVESAAATLSSTEDKSTARKSFDTEDQYRMLVEQASDGIHTYDLQGNIIDANSKLCEMLGYTKDELLRRNVKSLIPAEDAILNPIRFDELNSGKTLLRERRLLCRDGTILHVEISGKLIREGILQAIIRDISERKKTEERLKQNEEWLRNIFEASHDGILVEENEKIIYVNRAYTQMFGYDHAEELIGRHISVVVSADEIERVTLYGRKRLNGEPAPVKYEFRGKRRNETLISVEASVSTSNVAGHIYTTTMIRDITARRYTEILLEAQKQSLEMVVKGAPLAEVLLYLARVVEQQSDGQTAASILLLDAHGRLHNGASPSLSAKYLQAIENLKADADIGTCSAAAASGRIVVTPDIAADAKWRGLAHLALEEGFKSAWALPILARDGHVLGTFGSYFRELREPTDAERRAVEILGHTASLAIEGKQLEEALRSRENQLRLITDTIPLLISYIDREHRYRFVNQTYVEWFGKSRKKIIGRHISDIMGKDAYRQLLPEIEKVLAGEEVIFERLVPYKNGERFAQIHYVPGFDAASGQAAGFYAFVLDITERKNTQEELRRSHDELERRVSERTRELEASNQARIKVLQKLVTVQEDERQRIARDLHDHLGQQMTALRLNLDILKKMCAADGVIYAQVEETRNVARQIDSDVDFLAWQMRPSALDDLGIAAALEHYVARWSKNFKIPAKFNARRFADSPLPPEVETNLYRIAQESLNNVYKHARAGSVNIFLETLEDCVLLIVEDDGAGFEKNELAKKKRKGLGLIGMRERAALVGGALEIESAKNKGTTVYAKFPVRGKYE